MFPYGYRDRSLVLVWLLRYLFCILIDITTTPINQEMLFALCASQPNCYNENVTKRSQNTVTRVTKRPSFFAIFASFLYFPLDNPLQFNI